jgi:NADPH-dependent curcumin reductase CurA
MLLFSLGFPGPANFTIVTSTVDPASLQDGEVLVRVLAMSADPYLRNTVRSVDALTGQPSGSKV